MTVVGAIAIMVSGWVHFYLYFRGGYRGIAPDEVLGLTISRSFAINAIAAVVLAEALVLGLRYRALLLPAAAVGARLRRGDARGLLPVAHPRAAGFKETATTTEAVVAMVAEAVAIVTLVPVALTELRARRRPAR